MANNILCKKIDCCGCGACYNICPKQAIEMLEDEFGFVYPYVDGSKCVHCGLCKAVCSFRKEQSDVKVIESWVAVAKDKALLTKSASGGVFASLAKAIIREEGIVYGSAMANGKNGIDVIHIRVDKEQDLERIQGSKYVQSSLGTTYQSVKRDLEEGKMVLFSGTPCQVAGLNGFLGNRMYNNLVTIDIVCHGVPSIAFFREYIKAYEKKNRCRVEKFHFRDKQKGWGLNAKIVYIKGGNKVTKIVPSSTSSYYKLFLESKIYRENCYTCPYAGGERPGDISIGDYWGIESVHPEYTFTNGGTVKTEEGVSCILVNSERGKNALELFGMELHLLPSNSEKVIQGNAQLRHPSHRSEDRETILALFKKEGYEAVEDWYKKSLGIKYYLRIIWGKMPRKVKMIINRVRMKIFK